MSHILFVGPKFSSYVKYLDENGHTYTALIDKRKTKFPDKKFKNRIVGDLSTTESIIASLEHLKQPVDAIMTVYESYVLPAAIIAKHLGLPGLPIDAAEACTDKTIMRAKFADAPEKISPAFIEVKTEQELRNFAQSHAFPLILKPANLAKSLLVTKNDSLEELIANYHKSLELIHATYAKYAATRTPKMLVEEYLDGSVHSVDAFVDSDGTPHLFDQIVDYQTGYDVGYDDNFHYSRILPSKLSSDDQQALLHCADIGIRALGMKSSPAHVEVIMTKDGPRIVEIGARNGGYRERMHRLANSIDVVGGALAIALGKLPDISATTHNPVAVLELFPKAPGIYVGIHNEAELRALPSLNYLKIKAKPDQFVGKSSDGHKMCAAIILSSGNSEQFALDLQYVNENVYIVTR